MRLTSEEIRRIRHHLASSSFRHLEDFVSASPRQASEQEIYSSLRGCHCRRIDDRKYTPKMNLRLSFAHGGITAIDICYPIWESRQFPRLVFVDFVSRFTSASFLMPQDDGNAAV